MSVEKELKIYFTSDIHGYLFPTSYEDQKEGEIGLLNCVFNFKKDKNTLIIDGGDMLQGSPMAYYCQKNFKNFYPQAAIMNEKGYDFVTIGNHDFNYGYEYLKGYLNVLNATCICENVYDTLSNYHPYSYVIREMNNGLKVGIVGIVTDYVNVWEKHDNMKNLEIKDAFLSAKKALEKIKTKVDITICVYHGGFERDVNTGKRISFTKENIGNRICEELEFDLLLTGHQHMELSGIWINKTYVVQPPSKGLSYIKLNIRQKENSLIINSSLCGAGCMNDKSLYEQLLPLEKKVEKWLDESIGFLDKELIPQNKLSMAVNGSDIADFFNQVQLEYSGAQVSCVSLANDIIGFKQEVSIRDVISTYPFPNTLIILEVSGEVLKLALERAAEYFCVDNNSNLTISQQFLKPKIEHYNYDFFAGVHYVIDIKNPIGKRITKLSYEGIPIKMDDKLTMCVNNYRASGAGKYEMFKKCKRLNEIEIEISELIVQYLKKYRYVKVKKHSDFKVIY